MISSESCGVGFLLLRPWLRNLALFEDQIGQIHGVWFSSWSVVKAPYSIHWSSQRSPAGRWHFVFSVLAYGTLLYLPTISTKSRGSWISPLWSSLKEIAFFTDHFCEIWGGGILCCRFLLITPYLFHQAWFRNCGGRPPSYWCIFKALSLILWSFQRISGPILPF